MTLLVAFIAVVASILVIMYGANFLIDGGASIAKKMKVSSLVIGLTIVSLGTSAPELTVSLASSLSGSGGISLGNIVGSNIFNILAVLGLTAMITPLIIARSTAYHELPFLVFISLLAFFLAKDSIFRQGAVDVISRWDGVVLLLFFAIFLIYVFRMVRKGQNEGDVAEQGSIVEYPWLLSVAMIFLGLVMLVVGGNTFTINAVAIAKELGVSETMIGITLVATGTSIPELATTIVAARKNQVDIAVGNIVGSNICNLLLVGGLVSVISPISAEGISLLDMLMMLFSAVLLLLTGLFYGKTVIKRSEGLLLFLCYVVFVLYLFLSSPIGGSTV